MRNGRSAGSLILILLAGLVIGGFIGHYLSTVQYMGWIGYGKDFGIETMKLELGIISLSFGIMLRINVASVIGLLLGILVYKKV